MIVSSVNFIKGQLESYRECKNWLKGYDTKWFLLEHELTKIKGMNIGGEGGSGGSNESMRRSVVNDNMNELRSLKEHCERTIQICECILSKTKPEYREVMEMFYINGDEISKIESHTMYERNYIYRILRKETLRLSTL